GNWSLGDYFKNDSIRWSWEFLTSKKWLGISPGKIKVTVFQGDKDAPRDSESIKIWQECFKKSEISAEIYDKQKKNNETARIFPLPKEDNWWGPAGNTGPCGPDTEIFYWNSDDKVELPFNPEDGRWVEIWNNVFMEYEKKESGDYISLKQKNVDTGMGLERVAMILEGVSNVYEIASIKPIVEKVKEITGLKKLDKEQTKSVRIIVDHMRAATFILGDNKKIVPSNLDQGYILRRFIRRAIRHLRMLGVDVENNIVTTKIAEVVIKNFGEDYSELIENKDFIISELKKEEDKFRKTLEKGLKKFNLMAKNGQINAEEAFFLFQTYGFPVELIVELCIDKKVKVDVKGFDKAFKKHQEISRVGAEKKFKGGLSESSDMTKKLHTATHLLNEVLRRVLKEDIKQRGSNITPERLRFDFNFERKLTDDEKKKIEDMMNDIIQKGLPVVKEQMKLKDAFASGAHGEFGTKYPEEVWVYTMGEFSKEICNGPHADNTSELGKFRIKKEQSSSSGVRRIKAVLE
ncbi:MAG: alanine--tRNA ligase, partial [Nanoarchaeota archaeon]|nr:alanine--tRNA ligase [Nanoarchaeota archaeon]